MKIKNEVNRMNFAGYKNAVHNNIKADGMQLMFLSVQLNDDGVNDLTEFRKIQQLEGDCVNADVLNVFYSKIKGRPEYLFFNNKSMFWGHELRALWEVKRNSEAYKKEEKATLKAYTLLASLTRRMMQNGLCTKDASFTSVIKSAMNSYVQIFSTNPSSVFTLIQESVLENKSLEKTAEAFNKLIDRNMKIFLK